VDLGGKRFGYRDEDDLFTHRDKQARRFHEEEVFGADGRYLGEVRPGRLITNRSKAGVSPLIRNQQVTGSSLVAASSFPPETQSSHLALLTK
jgi:hypothetical protein